MQIRVGKRLKHITAARAGDGHDATLIGDVGDGDILAVEDVVIEPVSSWVVPMIAEFR